MNGGIDPEPGGPVSPPPFDDTVSTNVAFENNIWPGIIHEEEAPPAVDYMLPEAVLPPPDNAVPSSDGDAPSFTAEAAPSSEDAPAAGEDEPVPPLLDMPLHDMPPHDVPPPAAAGEPEVTGFLETISDEGWVLGWAWYPERPEERAEIEVLVDGLLTDTIRAANFRADVAQAGFGDGHYGFAWPLPYAVLAQPRDALISVRDKRSGKILPEPWVFRQRLVAQTEQRLSELESELRLLTARIAELTQRGKQEELAAAELFKVVGGFFTELAKASAEGGTPRQLRTLNMAVADVTAGFAPFSFSPSATPDVTVFVVAGGSAGQMYETLLAVHDTLGETAAEVYLLDDGTCDDAPLLPLVVQNMRYARLTSGEAAARYNDAIRLAGGKFVVFFAPGIKPAPGWPQALSAFAMEPGLAALAARLDGPDGELLNAGLELRNGVAALRGLGLEAGALAEPAVVDAVGAACFVLRQASWQRLGGLDEGFTSIAAALIDFCTRMKAAGETVSYAPDLRAQAIAAPAV